MSGLALLFSVLTLACLGLAGALAVATHNRRHEAARAATLKARLEIERHTHRRIMFGPEYRGDTESSAGCPMCGGLVEVAMSAFVLAQPPSRFDGRLTFHAAASAGAHVVRFEPCGCVWDSTATTAAAPGGFDLVCSVDSDTGFTRFGLATRDADEGPAEIITEVRGAGGESAGHR